MRWLPAVRPSTHEDGHAIARLRTVLGWPVGIAVVSWRYMWRTTPLHRSEEAGTRADLPDLAYDTSGFADQLQPLDAGVGPVLHRLYRVRITGSSIAPSALMDLVSGRLNQASPEMAKFRKTRGARGRAAGGR